MHFLGGRRDAQIKKTSILYEKKIILRDWYQNTYYVYGRTGKAKCKEFMKKGYLKTFWNCIRLEEEEREDLELDGCRKEQLE